MFAKRQILPSTCLRRDHYLISTDNGIKAKLPSPRYFQRRHGGDDIRSINGINEERKSPNSFSINFGNCISNENDHSNSRAFKSNCENQKNANIIKKMELQNRLKEKLKRKAMMISPLEDSSLISNLNIKKHANNSKSTSSNNLQDGFLGGFLSSIPSSPRGSNERKRRGVNNSSKRQKIDEEEFLSMPDLIDMLIPSSMPSDIFQPLTEFSDIPYMLMDSSSDMNHSNLKSDDTLLPFLDNSYLDLDLVPRGEIPLMLLKNDDFSDLWGNMDENSKNRNEMLYSSPYFFNNNFIS